MRRGRGPCGPGNGRRGRRVAPSPRPWRPRADGAGCSGRRPRGPSALCALPDRATERSGGPWRAPWQRSFAGRRLPDGAWEQSRTRRARPLRSWLSGPAAPRRIPATGMTSRVRARFRPLGLKNAPSPRGAVGRSSGPWQRHRCLHRPLRVPVPCGRLYRPDPAPPESTPPSRPRVPNPAPPESTPPSRPRIPNPAPPESTPPESTPPSRPPVPAPSHADRAPQDSLHRARVGCSCALVGSCPSARRSSPGPSRGGHRRRRWWAGEPERPGPWMGIGVPVLPEVSPAS